MRGEQRVLATMQVVQVMKLMTQEEQLQQLQEEEEESLPHMADRIRPMPATNHIWNLRDEYVARA